MNEKSEKTFLLPLSRISGPLAVEDVGAKASTLSVLMDAGFPVPDGFVITNEGLAYFLEANGLQREIEAITAEIERRSYGDIGDEPARIRALIERAPIPGDLARRILGHWRAMGSPNVSVRSSSNLEDGANRTFAGQHDSFLSIAGDNELLSQIKRVWMSLWSERAVLYLRSMPVSTRNLKMNVFVQRMAGGECSGVVFTVNPRGYDRKELTISVVEGWGEALVSGRKRPDELVLKRDVCDPREKHRNPGVTFEVHYLYRSGERELLSQEQASRLAEIALAAEYTLAMGNLDIEWSLSSDSFHLLQARPLIGMSDKADFPWNPPIPDTIWCRTWRLGEWLSDPVTPLFASWGLPLLIRSREQFGSGRLGWTHVPSFKMPEPWYCIVNGYFFSRHDLPSDTGRGMPFSSRLERLRSLRTNLEHWRHAHLPNYLTHFQEHLAVRLETLSPEALFEFVETLLSEAGEFWYLIAPIGYGFEEIVFKPIYEACLPGDDRPHYSLLFRGYPCLAIEGQQFLYDLSQRIEREPALARVFRQTPSLELARDSSLPLWLHEALSDYQMEHGHQLQSLDFYFPTLGEMIEYPITALQSLLRFGGREPNVVLEQIRREREDTRERVLERHLAGNPHKPLLTELIDCFQLHASVREEAIFHFQKGWPLIRRSLATLGRWLVRADRLTHWEQIFFLSKEETYQAVLELEGEKSGFALGHVAEARQKVWAYWRTLNPPDFLPVEAQHGQVQRQTGYFEDEMGKRFVGQGVSCGNAKGPARIIRSTHDIGALMSGDILVAKTASPSLTPFMLVAGGLIVDAGGGASHSSLIARELGLPAVVNTRCAVETLRDGQYVMVDGSTGIVRVLDG